MRISDWSSDVCSSDLPLDKSSVFFGSLSPQPASMNASEGRNIQPANFIGFPYLFAIISPLRLDHCLSGLLQCFSGAVAASTWRAYSGHNIWRSHSAHRSAEHTSELQSLMRTSYAVFCL